MHNCYTNSFYWCPVKLLDELFINKFTGSRRSKHTGALKLQKNCLYGYYITFKTVFTCSHVQFYCKVEENFTGQPFLSDRKGLVNYQNQWE